MKDFALLRRYVDALYDVARKTGRISSVDMSLRAFCELYSSNPDVKDFFESSRPKKLKKDFVQNLIAESGEKMDDLLINCLLLILDNDRAFFFQRILNAWEHQISIKENKWNAVVLTAKVPDDADKKKIESFLEKNEAGSIFTYEYNLDPSLIGGFRIKTKNRIYDSSIAGRLERLRRDLMGLAKG